MSYLAVEQLENNVTVGQKIKLDNSANLETLRLNMYKQGTLIDGEITIEVCDGPIILGTMTHSCIEFNEIGPNFHGMISFSPTNPIAIRKQIRAPYIELTFKITLSGHTNSDTAYLGLVRTPNSPVGIYNESNNPNPPDPTTDIWYAPFGLELYTT